MKIIIILLINGYEKKQNDHKKIIIREKYRFNVIKFIYYLMNIL